MPKDCRNIVCGNTVSDASGQEFCFSCLSELAQMRGEVETFARVWLPLEDEFVEWCREHGKPHPHE